MLAILTRRRAHRHSAELDSTTPEIRLPPRAQAVVVFDNPNSLAPPCGYSSGLVVRYSKPNEADEPRGEVVSPHVV